jgi:hypothetical protein
VLWLQGESERAGVVAEASLERAWGQHHAFSVCYALAFARLPIAFWRDDRAEAVRLVKVLREEADKHTLALFRSWAGAYELVLRTEPEALPEDLTQFQRETLGTIRGELVDSDLVGRAEAGGCGWSGPEILRAGAENRLLEGGAEASAESMLQRALEESRRQGATFWEHRVTASLERFWGARKKGTG